MIKCERCDRESDKTVQVKVLVKSTLNDRVMKSSRIIDVCPNCKREGDILENSKKALK
jgi:hypothetical protein